MLNAIYRKFVSDKEDYDYKCETILENVGSFHKLQKLREKEEAEEKGSISDDSICK